MVERLHEWSERINGARQFLLKIEGVNLCPGIRGKEGKIYSQAIRECLLLDMRNMSNFLEGGHIRFYDHKRNNKGYLVSVKATIEL